MNQEPSDRFGRAVGARAQRKRRAREHRENVWFGLGMFGVVGWSVVVPTLIGIGVGAWLDTRWTTPRISWTLTGLVLGITVGCALAWHWVRQESLPDADQPDQPSQADQPDRPAPGPTRDRSQRRDDRTD